MVLYYEEQEYYKYIYWIEYFINYKKYIYILLLDESNIYLSSL